MGKRKFLAEDIAEWTDYEKKFVRICIERKWTLIKDEDGTPILVPARTKDREIYKMSCDRPDLVALTVTAKHGRTKEAMLRKAEEANLQGTIFIEGETDVMYEFPIDRLARAVKTFNMKKKQRHPGPPPEAIKRGQEALRKYRENKKKMGKTDEPRV